MKSVGPDKFVDGIFLVDKFESLGWHLKSGATTLWRVWRQVEGDFGERIQFIPQNSTHWMSKPSGWRYLDIPVEDGFPRRKKKRRIK